MTKKKLKKEVRLAKWEKELLPVSLITTQKMARQVLLRNRALLKAVEERDDDYWGEIGCPHCQEADGYCSVCRWDVFEFYRGWGSTCLNAEFGGVRYSDAGISYREHNEMACYVLSIKKTRKFLKGHILWAARIIDGTYRRYAKKRGIKKPYRDKDGYWTTHETQ